MSSMFPNIDVLIYWIRERHNIYTRRTEGLHRPWTKDPILQSFRFCNVYRELDTVTQWIRENWRDPNRTDNNLWFGMAVARLLNWPDTLATIGYPKKWNRDRFLKLALERRESGAKVFTGAYMVSTNGHSTDKLVYLADRVFGPMWENRVYTAPRQGDTLDSFHQRLMECEGMGSFMAAQVVCDSKYALGSRLGCAPDWHTFAASGPGSRRGLNRIIGCDKNQRWREADWRRTLEALKMEVDAILGTSMPPIHAQDLQNCLCETDKYIRVRDGEGRPRSTYPGKA